MHMHISSTFVLYFLHLCVTLGEKDICDEYNIFCECEM